MKLLPTENVKGKVRDPTLAVPLLAPANVEKRREAVLLK